jgi:hypothetical protein
MPAYPRECHRPEGAGMARGMRQRWKTTELESRELTVDAGSSFPSAMRVRAVPRLRREGPHVVAVGVDLADGQPRALAGSAGRRGGAATRADVGRARRDDREGASRERHAAARVSHRRPALRRATRCPAAASMTPPRARVPPTPAASGAAAAEMPRRERPCARCGKPADDGPLCGPCAEEEWRRRQEGEGPSDAEALVRPEPEESPDPPSAA